MNPLSWHFAPRLLVAAVFLVAAILQKLLRRNRRGKVLLRLSDRTAARVAADIAASLITRRLWSGSQEESTAFYEQGISFPYGDSVRFVPWSAVERVDWDAGGFTLHLSNQSMLFQATVEHSYRFDIPTDKWTVVQEVLHRCLPGS